MEQFTIQGAFQIKKWDDENDTYIILAEGDDFEYESCGIEEAILNARLATETIDISLEGDDFAGASKSVNQIVVDEIIDICVGLGYQVAEGPEVESDHYNFELLNLPANHPARDMQDTFYIDEKTLLRNHT